MTMNRPRRRTRPNSLSVSALFGSLHIRHRVQGAKHVIVSPGQIKVEWNTELFLLACNRLGSEYQALFHVSLCAGTPPYPLLILALNTGSQAHYL